MGQLTRAFITHLHSDHTAGLPDLIFTPAVTGRLQPFEIYGPPGLGAMIGHILQAWREDMQIPLHDLEPAAKQAYVVHAHEIAPGEVYRDAAVRVTAIPVRHGAWKHAYAYRFDATDTTRRKVGKPARRNGAATTPPITPPSSTSANSPPKFSPRN
jgi:ribonuclease Z